VTAYYGLKYLKGETSNVMMEVAIDTGALFIPDVDSLMQSYKRRRLKNMNLAMEEILNSMDQIERSLQMKTSEQQDKK